MRSGRDPVTSAGPVRAGGKPNPGTKPDRRLTENKPKPPARPVPKPPAMPAKRGAKR